MGCLKEHVVKPGDDCSSIAKANSLALDAVKALNPGVCGPGLQDNTKLCLVFGKTDDCKRVCEGTEI
jgi:LysM repeat protein